MNYLNRNLTDRYSPVFECVYSIEILLTAVQFFVSIPVIRAVWRSQLHTNLRLLIICLMLYSNLSGAVRIYLIRFQTYRAAENDITVPLIVCAVARRSVIAYGGFVPLSTAIDRFIASKHWKWYSKGGQSTTFLFVVIEIIHISLSFLYASLLIQDYISDLAYMISVGIAIIIGSTLYYLVYRADYRELNIIKRGATINSYSITRSYQLKENMNLMRMFSRMALPVGVTDVPDLLFYCAFTFLQPGQYDFIRYLSIALHDVWIIIISLVIFISIPLCQPQIARHMPSGLQYSFFAVTNIKKTRTIANDTSTYFNQLSDLWNTSNRVASIVT